VRVELSSSPDGTANFGMEERARVARQTSATHDIPCKSILMSRVEERFTGFNYLDLVHQYTQMGFALEDILSECARMSLSAVADKCRAEAFRSACTQKHTPDLNSLNSLEAAHRKLVYSTALSQVHPSKFYQTVPACETCFQLYSCLDSMRETIVFLRQDGEDNPSADPREHHLLPGGEAGPANGSHSHSHVTCSSGGENQYYKTLQRSLSRYSRDCSDSAHSAEQQVNSDRLAEPKRVTKKFDRPGSAVRGAGRDRDKRGIGSKGSGSPDGDRGGGRERAYSPDHERSGEHRGDFSGVCLEDSVPRTHRPSFTAVPLSQRQGQGSQRPLTAGGGVRKRDLFIEGQLSDRRTSKLPYNARSNQKQMHQQSNSKYVNSKRAAMPKAASRPRLESFEDLDCSQGEDPSGYDSYSDGRPPEPSMSENNNSSYFAGEAEDGQLDRSSYLIMASAVPRVHSQSGPTLGKYPVSFGGKIPQRTSNNIADPDKNTQIKNFDNIKVAQNVDRGPGKIVVTDQHGAEHAYNNLQFVHSL
jgi:hypothetical protein